MTMGFAIFFAGMFVSAFAASGLFFLKFWKISRDPFFLHFVIFCWIMCLERVTAVVLEITQQSLSANSETLIWVYLIRLLAFAVILSAILKKNGFYGR